MYKFVGFRFADCMSFSKIFHENEGLSETKLFHIHRIFKNGGRGLGGSIKYQINGYTSVL